VRVYLACTVRGDRAGLDAARAAASRLRALGHEVLTSHLLDDHVEQAESALTEAEVFERDLRWLDTCDLLVAEASGSTYGVGFEVGYLTGRAGAGQQRVIVLYDASRRGVISRLVSGYHSPRGVAFGYRTAAEVERFIEQQCSRADPHT
jgi:2'-deoxynucleoside 5'-phosphate N-hydrolase